MKIKQLINKVDDGFNYFNSGFIEELTFDKKYYVKVFMDYIEYLEKRTLQLNNNLKLKTKHHEKRKISNNIK
tara:strand:+ start:136 stop:351 length:216 start_codon:yes stop_codon:yes gene_type:complete